MKISTLDKYAPHILKFVRENLSKFDYGSHPIDEEIETVNVEYLIAYAYREKVGIGIPDCIALLGDYKRLQNAASVWMLRSPKDSEKIIKCQKCVTCKHYDKHPRDIPCGNCEFNGKPLKNKYEYKFP